MTPHPLQPLQNPLRYPDPPSAAQRQAWHAEARARARALREAAFQGVFEGITQPLKRASGTPCLAEA